MNDFSCLLTVFTVIPVATLIFFIIFNHKSIKEQEEILTQHIKTKHKDVERIVFPSTDNKSSAIVFDKQGKIYYYRTNAFGDVKNEVELN